MSEPRSIITISPWSYCFLTGLPTPCSCPGTYSLRLKLDIFPLTKPSSGFLPRSGQMPKHSLWFTKTPECKLHCNPQAPCVHPLLIHHGPARGFASAVPSACGARPQMLPREAVPHAASLGTNTTLSTEALPRRAVLNTTHTHRCPRWLLTALYFLHNIYHKLTTVLLFVYFLLPPTIKNAPRGSDFALFIAELQHLELCRIHNGLSSITDDCLN